MRSELSADPNYPWSDVILQMPPPAPVVNQVIKRAGIPGLDDEELVLIAQALLDGCDADSPMVVSVASEVRDRRLTDRVVEPYVRSLLHRVPPVTPDEAAYAGERLFEIVVAGEPVRRTVHPDPWARSYDHPWD